MVLDSSLSSVGCLLCLTLLTPSSSSLFICCFLGLCFVLHLKFLIVCMYVMRACVCGMCVLVSVYVYRDVHGSYRHQIPWNWNCRWLWAAKNGSWESSLCPLEEQYILLSTGPSFQSLVLHPYVWIFLSFSFAYILLRIVYSSTLFVVTALTCICLKTFLFVSVLMDNFTRYINLCYYLFSRHGIYHFMLSKALRLFTAGLKCFWYFCL